MKCVHIVRQFHPSVGGLEDSVLNMATGLQALGCDIRVVTLDRVFGEPERPLPAQDVVSGIPVTRIPYSGSKRYPFAPSVLKHLGDADLVHVHAIDFFFDFMALTRPLHGKPLVASTHGGFFHTEFAARAKKIYFDAVTRSSALAYRRIFCGSDNDAAIFRRIAPKKVETIQTGVNVAKLADAGSPIHKKTLIYFGRLSSNKRVAALFPLLAQLRALDPEWRLTLAGGVWDMSLQDLHAQIAASGVGEYVRHIDKPSTEQMRAAIGEASYFVSASAYEGFGITAVEAMSAGLLPILSDIPTFRALIDRTRQGALFNPDEPAAAAATIVACSGKFAAGFDPIRAHLKTIAGLYAWPAVAGKFLEEYRRALAGVS